METELYNAAKIGDINFLNHARNKEIESGSDEYFLKQTSHKNNILHIAARRENFEFIEVVLKGLISKTAINILINQRNENGNTPVHVAAEVGNLDIFNLFLDYVYGQTVYVCGQSVHDEGKVLWMQNTKGNMPLHVALINGNVDVATFLIEMHPDMVYVKNFAEETPLHLATIHQPIGKDNYVSCMRDARGSTPLHNAASITSAYNLQIIKLILDHCPQSAELCDGSSKTILHLLKTIPSYKDGKDLLGITEIFDLRNHQDDQGNTPLHTAAMNMNFNMVRVLSDSSTKRSIRNNNGISAASIIQEQFETTVEKNQMTVEVCEAIDRVKISFLKERLHSFGNNFLFSRDSNRRNVLHKLMHINEGAEIIYHDFVDFIQQVLESFPTFMGQVDLNGDTPLHILMQNAPDTTIRLSMESGIYSFSTYSESHLGSKLLEICCEHFDRNNEEAREKGIHYDQPWLVQNMEGNTPLHEALKVNHNAMVVENFLNLDIEITAKLRNKLNETPLHLAAGCSLYSDLAKKDGVIEKLAKVNQEAAYAFDKNGLTPLLRAAQHGNLLTISMLYKMFPDVAGIPDEKYGQTLWHLLLKSSEYVTWYLLKAHPDLRYHLTFGDYEGNTPLHLALQSKRFDHASKFLAYMNTEQKKNLLEKPNDVGVTPADLTRSYKEIPPKLDDILNREPEFIGYRSVYGVSTGYMEDYVNTIGVIAALLTTVTFTATISVPGGLIQETDNKKTKGTPILVDDAAFQVFMFFDILTMCLSTMVLFCLLWILAFNKRDSLKLMDSCIFLLSISFNTTLWTFMAAVYATTIHVKPWIAIYTLVLCPLLTLLMQKYTVIKYVGPIGPFLSFYKTKVYYHVHNWLMSMRMHLCI